MSIFGGNLINFLGGVAEGASKEISRQQAEMSDMVKTASNVIINDRIATRKRKQKRMMELGAQYEFLKAKGLGNREIKIVLEQGLFEDIATLAKKRNMTPEKLKSSINVVGGEDIPINKSALLNYLSRDIVDADLTNLQITGGVDTMGALGIKRPVGEQVKRRVSAIAPKTSTDVDMKIAGITGDLSEKSKMLLDKSSKMSTAAFRKLATTILINRRGGKVNFVPDPISGSYTLRTEGVQQEDVLKAQAEAENLTKKYNSIVFEEGGVNTVNGFTTMSSPEAVQYLLFPNVEVQKEILSPVINNKKETLEQKKKKRIVPDTSQTPQFSNLMSLDSMDGSFTFSQEVKNLKGQGIGTFPADIKSHYIMTRAAQIQSNNSSIDTNVAWAQATKEVKDYLTSQGF